MMIKDIRMQGLHRHKKSHRFPILFSTLFLRFRKPREFETSPFHHALAAASHIALETARKIIPMLSPGKILCASLGSGAKGLGIISY